MFGFGIIKVNKITRIAKYFDLLDFQDPKDLTKIQSIIGIFELDEMPLKCTMRVPQDSEFLSLSNFDGTIEVNIIKTQNLPLCKKTQSDIVIKFYGNVLEKIINLAAKEGEALYIISNYAKGEDIELILNNNNHNYINFSIKKYNVEEIKAKIKNVCKRRNI